LDLSPQALLATLDLSNLENVLTPDEALALIKAERRTAIHAGLCSTTAIRATIRPSAGLISTMRPSGTMPTLFGHIADIVDWLVS
jgi:hypothetical protein